MTKSFNVVVAIIGTIALQVSTAQAGSGGYVLPQALASEAATEAIKVCESSGYRVSAAVVDDSGVLKLFMKGDKSTIHTYDASFRKAYTVVTMGPIFKFDASSQFVERFSKNPSPPALSTLPNIALLPGAVAIRVKGEIVAALGVGGAAGGDKDEICAQAGLAKISDRLPK